MEYIASGAQADIYKDGSKAIKMFKYNINKAEVEWEANAQKMAFEYGLPVPQIYDIIEKDGKYGIVMEYIEGEPLGKIMLEDKSIFEEYIIKSIELQNSIHKIETNKYPQMKERLKRHILRVDKIENKDKENILAKLENTIFENKLCHGDLHVYNLLKTKDGIKIIDWINATSGSPCADIYRTYLLYKVTVGEVADMFLDAYCKVVNINKQNVLSWAPIMAAERLGEQINFEKEEKILKEIIQQSLLNN